MPPLPGYSLLKRKSAQSGTLSATSLSLRQGRLFPSEIWKAAGRHHQNPNLQSVSALTFKGWIKILENLPALCQVHGDLICLYIKKKRETLLEHFRLLDVIKICPIVFPP